MSSSAPPVPVSWPASDGKSRMPNLISWITVEPSAFFVSFAFGLTRVANAKLYVDRTCTEGSTIFGNGTVFKKSVCDNLSAPENAGIENFVEEQVINLMYVAGALQVLPQVLIALLAGPWSSRVGRTPLIMMPILGFVIFYAILICIAEVQSMGPDFILLECLQDLTGGLSLFMLGAFAYIADVSSPHIWTSRMAALEFFVLGGLALGRGISDPMFKTAGFTPMYILSLMLVLIGIFSVPIFVKNRPPRTTIRTDSDSEIEEHYLRHVSVKKQFKALIKTDYIAESFRSVTQKREKHRRHIILLVVLTFSLLEFVDGGERVADALYLRDAFPFQGFAEFNSWWIDFYAIFTAWGLFSLVMMIPLLKQVYHVPDPVFILACALGGFFRALTFMLANKRNNLYIGSFVDMFNLAGLVVCRASVASLVPPGEIGAAFAVLASSQSLMRCLSNLYHMIYTDTQDFYGGFVFCLNATIFVFVALISVYIWSYYLNHVGPSPKEVPAARTPKKDSSGVAQPAVKPVAAAAMTTLREEEEEEEEERRKSDSSSEEGQIP